MEKNTTALSWTAWYVYYEPPCEGREDIGFYQNELDAEAARNNFIENKKLSNNGICCSNQKYVYKKQILIQQ